MVFSLPSRRHPQGHPELTFKGQSSMEGKLGVSGTDLSPRFMGSSDNWVEGPELAKLSVVLQELVWKGYSKW